MRVVSIKRELLTKYREADKEVLWNDDRPFVVVIKLMYRGRNRIFAVPCRSNIPCYTQTDEYYPLPNRDTTKNGNHHGIHYIKMVPVSKRFYEKYAIDKSEEAKRIVRIINDGEKKIIEDCKRYLHRYESEHPPLYSTDIDKLIQILDSLPVC